MIRFHIGNERVGMLLTYCEYRKMIENTQFSNSYRMKTRSVRLHPLSIEKVLTIHVFVK